MMPKTEYHQQILNYSLPILTLGMVMSGIARIFFSYTILSFVIVGIMSAAAAIFFLTLIVEGVDRVSLRLIFGAAVLIGTIATLMTVFAPARGVDLKILGKVMLQLSLLVGWIGYCSKCPWHSPITWHVLTIAATIVLAINAGLWVNDGFPLPFHGLATAKNSLATIALVGLFLSLGLFQFSTSKYSHALWMVCLGLSLIVMISSVGRSAMVATAVTCVVSVSLRLTRSRIFHGMMFVLLLISFVAGPVLYISFSRSTTAKSLDVLSRKAVNLSLFTGRESLWPILIEQVKRRPFFGHGTKTPMRFVRKHKRFQNREDARVELSAHNLYLVTAYQTGLVGLLALFLFFGSIWRSLIETIDTPLGRLAIAFFIAFLFRENFEISLTQNNLQMGLSEWAIIASGMSIVTRRLQRQDREESPENIVDDSIPEPQNLVHS